MVTLSVLAALVASALADDRYHRGEYHSNDAGVFWFYFFFVIILMILLFGCVGGIYTWGGHVRTVRVERIVDRDASGKIIRDRTINDSSTVVTDDINGDQYTMAQPYRPLPAGDYGRFRANTAKRPIKLNFNV